MPSTVLDASAILAFLQDEPGADVVEEALTGSMVSAVNLAEVASKLSDFGMPDDEIAATVVDLRMDVAYFDEEAAFASATLRAATRANGAVAWRPRMPRVGGGYGCAGVDSGPNLAGTGCRGRCTVDSHLAAKICNCSEESGR